MLCVQSSTHRKVKLLEMCIRMGITIEECDLGRFVISIFMQIVFITAALKLRGISKFVSIQLMIYVPK